MKTAIPTTGVNQIIQEGNEKPLSIPKKALAGKKLMNPKGRTKVKIICMIRGYMVNGYMVVRSIILRFIPEKSLLLFVQNAMDPVAMNNAPRINVAPNSTAMIARVLYSVQEKRTCMQP